MIAAKAKSRSRCVTRVLYLALLLVPAAALGREPEGGSVISVLSYNVHGLFPLIAKDNPRDRAPTIGWLANKYDVVLLQEDFEYHNIIRQQMPGSVGVRGNGMGYDPRRLVVKVLLAPVALFLPHFSPPYGAGVSTFVKSALIVRRDVDRKAYGVCRGWLGAHADCWATKGYLRVGMRTPAGAKIDVYNTHLQTGPGRKSNAARRQQLDSLARAIERRSAQAAIIVGGDFNVGFNRLEEREAVMVFRRRLDLSDSGAGPELPFWRDRDYILYRSGADVMLDVEDMGEATEFVNQRRALSDHPALYARFRVKQVQGGAQEEP